MIIGRQPVYQFKMIPPKIDKARLLITGWGELRVGFTTSPLARVDAGQYFDGLAELINRTKRGHPYWGC